MAFTPGTRLGAYEVLALLGTGGMGEVYRGRDTRLERVVAIKVLPASVASDPDRRQRLDREARAISSLNHPHICTLYDVGHQDGIDYLVMEFLEGQTLAERLTRGALTLDQALQCAIQLADALDVAHRRGIVHRDLKPANVFISCNGSTSAPVTKLLDFGIAKASALGPAATNVSATLTDEGTLLGTVQYMAPEQLEGQAADARSDLFAFGAVLYEMLAGRRAFPGDSKASVIAAVLDSEPPPLSASQSFTPPALEHLVKTCLAKNPNERWQTAGDVKRQLSWIAATSRATAQATRDGRLVTRPVFKRWRTVVAAVVAVSAAGFAGWRWQQASVAPPQPRVEFTIDLAPVDDIAAGAPEDPSPTASPDGTRVLFRTGGRVNARWWIRSVDSTKPLELPVVAKANLVQWSPDSKHVVWCSNGIIWTAAIVGGSPSRVVEGCGPSAPSWSRRGAIIFTAADGTGLRLASDGGGPSTALTAVDREHGENWHRFPVFLPDAVHYVFLVHGSNRERAGIYLGTLGEGTPVRLMAERSRPVVVERGDGGVDLVFVVRGSLVVQRLDVQKRRMAGERRVLATRLAVGLTGFDGAYTASDRLLAYRHGGGNLYDRSRLLWFDRSGAQIGEIALPGDNGGGISSLSLSADQQHLLFSRWATDTATTNVWSYDLRRNVAQQLLHDDFLSFDGPEWAPDAKSFVYASTETGQWEMREHDQSGTDRHLAAVYPSQYGSSGRFLLVTPPSPSAGSLSTFDLLSRSTTLVPGAQRVQTALSRDERWLAYSSREAGQSDIYVQPFPVGPPVLVSTSGGVDPRWREDGRELYYINNDGWIIAVPFEPGAPSNTGKAAPLFRIPVPSGTALVPSIMGRSRYAPAGNGRRFLISVPVGEPHEVRVVTNWRERELP